MPRQKKKLTSKQRAWRRRCRGDDTETPKNTGFFADDDDDDYYPSEETEEW